MGQVVEALACWSEGQGFEPRHEQTTLVRSLSKILNLTPRTSQSLCQIFQIKSSNMVNPGIKGIILPQKLTGNNIYYVRLLYKDLDVEGKYVHVYKSSKWTLLPSSSPITMTSGNAHEWHIFPLGAHSRKCHVISKTSQNSWNTNQDAVWHLNIASESLVITSHILLSMVCFVFCLG